jgi:hypothetical protein
MSEGAEVQRLLQAVQHFQNRSRGAELPKGAAEAIEGLQKALGQPAPGRDTPGAREALKQAPGNAPETGTGTPMKSAAVGNDRPSPGQREAQDIQARIAAAAAEIAGGSQQAA